MKRHERRNHTSVAACDGSNLRLAVLGGVCRPWLASGVAIGSRAADRRAPSTIPAGIRRVTIHLALVITLAMTIGDGFLREFPRHGLAIGGFAYLLIYGLAAAALVDMRTQRAVRIPILHSSAFQGFAAYFIWTVFALVFVGGVFRRPATYTLLQWPCLAPWPCA